MGRGWFTGPGIGVLNGIFLRLDCTNDPLTAGLEINAATAGEPVLILQTTDDNVANPSLEVQNAAGAMLGEWQARGGLNFAAAVGQATPGIMGLAGSRFLHTYGTNSLFIGINAGNFTLAGTTNLGIGQNVLGNNTTGHSNLAFGYNALAVNTTGYWNVACGISSLAANIDGYENMAMGYDTLVNNVNGYYNVAIGTIALRANVSGAANLAIGRGAMYRNITGIQNVAIGMSALSNNTAGHYNIAVGGSALQSNLTGSYCVAVGTNALQLSVGDYNVGIGDNALALNNVGGGNTAIGFYAGRKNVGSYSVFIGYMAGYNETTSNKLYIANTLTATPLIYGEFDNLFMRNYAASALTATISNPLRTAHVTSGGALALFGVGHLHELEDGAGNLQTASEAVTLWAVETDDAEMPLRRWTTYPAGNAGPGYGGYITANDVDNVAQTIIPNGTGDVVCVLSVLYAVCVSDGNTAGGATTVNNGANVALYNAGGNTLTLAVAADGSTTLQRTADAGAGLSYDVSLIMSWI